MMTVLDLWTYNFTKIFSLTYPLSVSVHCYVAKSPFVLFIIDLLFRKKYYFPLWIQNRPLIKPILAKKNCSLRLCLDPKRRNGNFKRCHHKIPTVEELYPTFAYAKYFRKLDLKVGYWPFRSELPMVNNILSLGWPSEQIGFIWI